MALRVLVADDSILFRRVVCDVLKLMPEVEVVGSVANGRLALQRVHELKPDLLTLDIEMPELDGIGVLNALKTNRDPVRVIVVSGRTPRGGQLTMRAMELGAFDFITKPEDAGGDAFREELRRELGQRVKVLLQLKEIRGILAAKPSIKPLSPVSVARVKPAKVAAARIATGKPDLVLIGVSTGGPNALATLFPELPGNLDVPVVVVQHMPPLFTASLAESLASKCALRVKEAEHGEVLRKNVIYIAPGGRHLRLAPDPTGDKVVHLTDDPPENNCRPAADYLFRSVAYNFPGKAIAVILTGMGNDGTEGVRALKRGGCFSIAQDEASCVVYGMSKSVIDEGLADRTLPLGAIAKQITGAIHGAFT